MVKVDNKVANNGNGFAKTVITQAITPRNLGMLGIVAVLNAIVFTQVYTKFIITLDQLQKQIAVQSKEITALEQKTQQQEVEIATLKKTLELLQQ